ncbi:MAG: hypothetical protein OK454_06535 [Thaumarchaeota archaeon]|nr:hypothetical protein [Nitrososphaerota archaeon]
MFRPEEIIAGEAEMDKGGFVMRLAGLPSLRDKAAVDRTRRTEVVPGRQKKWSVHYILWAGASSQKLQLRKAKAGMPSL